MEINMRRIVMIAALYTTSCFSMEKVTKYLFGNTDPKKVPVYGQAILDKNKRLIGYHTRNDQNSIPSFELFNTYNKKLAIWSYENNKETTQYLSGNMEDKLFVNQWTLQVLNYILDENQKKREATYTTKHVSTLTSGQESTDHVIGQKPPLILDHEIFDMYKFWSMTKEKLFSKK